MEEVAMEGASSPARASPLADASSDSPEMRKRAREQIHEATATIPEEEKAAYLEAREKASFLFENESDPYKFLLTCDFNIWQAAKRMAVYWEERKKLFGPTRAFLPLTLTGDGALTKEDIQSMQGGFPAVLPDTAAGQKIAYCDRRQWLATATAEQRLRTCFYIVRVFSDSERTLREGVVALILLVTPRISEIDLSFVKRGLHLASTAFPLKVAHWHLLNVPPKHAVKTKKQYMIQDMIVSFVTSVVEKGFKDHLDVHFEREPGEIFKFFQTELGLAPDGIPREFGGTWDFTHAISWCRKQALEERGKYKLTLQAVKRTKKSAASRQEKAKVDRVSKRRANNAMHSKRKRERRLQESANLTTEHSNLVQENADLKAEQARLEEILKQAKQVEAYLEPCTSSTSAHGRPDHTLQIGRVPGLPSASSMSTYHQLLWNPADLPANADPRLPHFMHHSSLGAIVNNMQGQTNATLMLSQQLGYGGYAPVIPQQQQALGGMDICSVLQVSGEHPCREQQHLPGTGTPRSQFEPSIVGLATAALQRPIEEREEFIRILLRQQQPGP